ncbi:MAG: hypothetical protein ACRERC_16185 [Candidatus Binatia bacterium]
MGALSIVAYRHDPALGGSLPHMRKPATQRRWDVFLKAFEGLPLAPGELVMFQQMSGRTTPRPGGYSEGVAVVARQAGKDDTCSDTINADAVGTIISGVNVDGQFSVAVAQDHRSSVRTIFHRLSAPWRTIPMLRQHVVAFRSESFELDNGLTVVAMPCRPAAPRGLRVRVFVMNETDHYQNSEGNPVDFAMRRAALPTTATTGGKLLIVSSPFLSTGLLGTLHAKHWGRADSPTLVIQGSAPDFNPTLPADYLQKMKDDDPDSYATEVLGEFSRGTSTLFDDETVAACTMPVAERLPAPGRQYVGSFDASGGAHDAAAGSVGHTEATGGVVDAVRRWPSPHDPSAVVAEAADFFRRYGVRTVLADRYAGNYPVSEFKRHGITLEHCPLDRSALYLNLLPRARAAAVCWPNDGTLLRELRGLVRKRSAFGGKQNVDHRPGGFDDVAVTVAGVVYQLTTPRTVHGGDPTRVLGI